MPSQYPRSPKIIKGALIQFSAPMLIPIPNIIIFQYNPETMTRKLSPWGPATNEGQGASRDPKQENHLAQPFDPNETFSLSLELDAADALAEPETHPIAVISGVADRIAAMEMLLYPPGESTLGGLLGVSVNVSLGGSSFGASVGGPAEPVPCKTVPVVLFFWGPGRVVPVRIKDFSVDEQAYSPLLYPIRAKVTIGLQILDARAFDNQEQTAAVKIAKACYTFTRAQKEGLATANIANTVESIIGMLPF
jgi:hypothetical protein